MLNALQAMLVEGENGTGLLVALIVALAPVLRASLTSGLVFLVNKGTTWIAGLNNTLKRLVTVAAGVLVANVFNAVAGVVIPVDPMAWTEATAAGAAEGLIAAIIYWIGSIGKGK